MTKSVENKLVIRDLRKSFDGVPALDGINLEVKAGEILTLIGPSGSGKTLTLKCVLGLIKPDSGSVLLDGREVTDLPEQERMAFFRNFGMQFQRSGKSEEHTSELQSRENLVCRLLLEKKKKRTT